MLIFVVAGIFLLVCAIPFIAIYITLGSAE